jgi:hypothetical protein
LRATCSIVVLCCLLHVVSFMTVASCLLHAARCLLHVVWSMSFHDACYMLSVACHTFNLAGSTASRISHGAGRLSLVVSTSSGRYGVVAKPGSAEDPPDPDEALVPARIADSVAASVAIPGNQGLHWDWALPCRTCTGTPTSYILHAEWARPAPHPHRSCARCCRICAGNCRKRARMTRRPRPSGCAPVLCVLCCVGSGVSEYLHAGGS